MSKVIRIPSGLFSRLEAHAKGFDTPANVIEKILNHYEGIQESSGKSTKPSPSGRDNTQYLFQGRTYGKGRLVLAVIKNYAENHPHISADELRAIFPEQLQGSEHGVLKGYAEAQKIFEQTGHKRHFLKPNELVQLSDTTIAVSNQWGKGNIDNFIQAARAIGYEITPVEK